MRRSRILFRLEGDPKRSPICAYPPFGPLSAPFLNFVPARCRAEDVSSNNQSKITIQSSKLPNRGADGGSRSTHIPIDKKMSTIYPFSHWVARLSSCIITIPIHEQTHLPSPDKSLQGQRTLHGHACHPLRDAPTLPAQSHHHRTHLHLLLPQTFPPLPA